MGEKEFLERLRSGWAQGSSALFANLLSAQRWYLLTYCNFLYYNVRGSAFLRNNPPPITSSKKIFPPLAKKWSMVIDLLKLL